MLFSPWRFRKLSLRAWLEPWKFSSSQLLLKKNQTITQFKKKQKVCGLCGCWADLATANFHWCSVPEPAECSPVCKRQGCLHSPEMVQGRERDVAQQCSIPFITGASACAAFGGSRGPLHFSSSQPHECCLQLLWAANGRRLLVFLLQKEKTLYLSQSSPIHHMLLFPVRRGAV